MNDDDTKAKIHAKIVELARSLRHDARSLKNDQEIPSSGLLDSPTLMELIIWFEGEFDVEIDQDQLTLENFGTIDAMAAYAQAAQA